MGGGNDWVELARSATRRRVELGHKARRTFAQHIGVSLRTLEGIEKAERTGFSPATKIALEDGLLWRRGSFDRVVAGGEPEELPIPAPDGSPLADVDSADLVAQISERLSELARRAPEGPRRRTPPHPRDDPTAMTATGGVDAESPTGRLRSPDAQAG